MASRLLASARSRAGQSYLDDVFSDSSQLVLPRVQECALACVPLFIGA
jgi:glutaredoxin 2